MATGLAAATSIGAGLALVPGCGVRARRSPLRFPMRCSRRRRRFSRIASIRWTTNGGGWGACGGGIFGYAVAVLVVPGHLAPPACAAGALCRGAGDYLGRLAVTGFRRSANASARRGLESRPVAANGRTRPAEVETEVSETTELAGNVVSATAGEIIETALAADDEDAPKS